jgi:CIC family chloride channel protein
MTREVVSIENKLTVKQAFDLVQKLSVHYHAYPIVDGQQRLVGLVTFNDLKRGLATHQDDLSVGTISSKNIVHAHPDHTLDTVMLKLGRRRVSQLPVVSRKDPSKLLGIITMHDVAQALARTDDRSEITLQPVSSDAD